MTRIAILIAGAVAPAIRCALIAYVFGARGGGGALAAVENR